MFTIIKYAIYAFVAVFVYYIVKGVIAENPQQQVEQSVSFLNEKMQSSVQSIVTQFNKNLNELSQQSSDMLNDL